METGDERVEHAVNLQCEITRYAAVKGGTEDSWSGPVWVVVEGEASQFAQAVSANSSWRLTMLADSARDISIREIRTSAERPTTAWLLVSEGGARMIDSVPASMPWRLVTGTSTAGLVEVRGYYVKNGTEFRSHVIAQSGVTGAGATRD
jgi:hypothetical protein